ncbi:MAG: hypothetical protein H6807_10275 [Planctomycetes bacterium]|nr:hypothetical protein [Planctomycetota bacterium]
MRESESERSIMTPAITCAAAGLLLPLMQIPAMLLTPLLGTSALFVVPAAIFGAMLAFGLVFGDAERTQRCMRFTALGFAAGAFLSGLVLGAKAQPGFVSALFTGAAGGFALSFGCVERAPSRILVAAATAVSFALVGLIGFGGTTSGCGG